MRVKANLLQALARRDRRIVPVVGRVGVRPGITRSGPAGRFHVVGFDGVKRAVLKAVGEGSLRLSAAPAGAGAGVNLDGVRPCTGVGPSRTRA